MALILFPEMQVLTGPIIAYDSFATRPPLCWQVPMESVNAEDGSEIVGGRYFPNDGKVLGHGEPKMQDTFLTGTASRTGRDFTAFTGIWYDDWVSPQSDCYGLFFPDGSAGALAEVRAATASAGLES